MIFNIQDRQETFDFILSIAKACEKIVALVQVGSGAVGFTDEHSDLDFVVALDSNDSMKEVMDYFHQKVSQKYEIIYHGQIEQRRLEVFVLSNLLAINRGALLRARGIIEYVRSLYVDLLGDRYRLESKLNREMDKLPPEEIAKIKSTFITEDTPDAMWVSLLRLTDLIYKELEGQPISISKEMLLEYYEDLK